MICLFNLYSVKYSKKVFQYLFRLRYEEGAGSCTVGSETSGICVENETVGYMETEQY